MVSMLDLKNALFEGGVVGAGGAGFPTHAKLSDQADTVILNCAECEPLIKVDRQLMVDYINEILSGMQMMVEAMGAKEGIIAVKKSYTASIEAVKSNIGNYKNRPRRVVFYGRVSTEHEEQISALGNQMEWYTDLALRNPNWTVVVQYIYEGITGTEM